MLPPLQAFWAMRLAAVKIPQEVPRRCSVLPTDATVSLWQHRLWGSQQGQHGECCQYYEACVSGGSQRWQRSFPCRHLSWKHCLHCKPHSQGRLHGATFSLLQTLLLIVLPLLQAFSAAWLAVDDAPIAWSISVEGLLGTGKYLAMHSINGTIWTSYKIFPHKMWNNFVAYFLFYNAFNWLNM